MPRHLTLGVVLGTLIFTFSAAAQQVQRPGFEGDPADHAPWVEYGDAVANDPNNDARIYVPPTLALNEAKEGQNVYGAARDGVSMRTGIRQTLSGFVHGRLYALSVWVYTYRLGQGSGSVRIGVDRFGRTDPGSTDVLYTPPHSDDGRWSQVVLPFIAQGPNVTIFLDIALGGGGFSIAYVDQVEMLIQPDLTTPCPLESNVLLEINDCRLDLDENPEAEITVPPGYIITGLGFRAGFDDIDTMRVQLRELRPDGTLGPPMEQRAGSEPQAGLEVNVTLPECHVMVGFGARAAYETDVTTMAVWARPLLPDGTLGEVVEFRSGTEPNSHLERQFMLTGNRVLTGAGMRTTQGDVTGLYAQSCALEAIIETTASTMEMY